MRILDDGGGRRLVVGELAAIVAGGVLHPTAGSGAGDAAWAAGAALALIPLTWAVARSVAARRIGVDVIALVAIVGALALEQYLAGAIVALMMSGGSALEAAAAGRARRELTALVSRAPAHALLRRDGRIDEVPVDEVRSGDTVVVRTGDVVPVDGTVADGEAVLDEAALTGEPLPVSRPRGAPVRSGVVNVGPSVDLRASRPASESAYAALVRLVREAETRRAPFVRMADRYAALFLPITLGLALAAWGASGDPVRALAVLVVATPCPLILAAPVALLSGVSRAARRGIIVKGSGAVEVIGRVRAVLLDKTGTLTLGAPTVRAIVPRDGVGADELLRLVASVEQLSANVVAQAIVTEARARGIALSAPRAVEEGGGLGVEGTVDGRRVTAGSRRWLARQGYDPGADAADADGATGSVMVGIDGVVAGELLLADALRDEAPDAIRRMRAAGVRHVAVVTGDAAAPAGRMARGLDVDAVHADLSPAAKVDVVRRLQRDGAGPVLMVGDGINDAPALAAADVGIAMAAAGGTVSSEAADAVVTIDRLDRIADAVAIGRRSLRIARQSVIAGMALSGVAMVVAAFGGIPPVAGALLQEGIDVAVILNALRALRGDAGERS